MYGLPKSNLRAATYAEVAEVQRPLIADRFTEQRGLGVMQTERWQELASQLLNLEIIDRAEPERAVTSCE
jgi:NitT/TauT family transport system substrate-binding protein